MKTAILLLLSFSIIEFSCSKINTRDVLSRYSVTIPYLELVSTQTQDDAQIKYQSIYRVNGENAIAIEKILHDNYGMPLVEYVCCGWENTNNAYGEFQKSENKGSAYIFYTLEMYSDDTIITSRTEWYKIPYFYVVAQVSEI